LISPTRSSRDPPDDKFPLAPRLETLRSALAKLDPARAAALRRPPARARTGAAKAGEVHRKPLEIGERAVVEGAFVRSRRVRRPA